MKLNLIYVCLLIIFCQINYLQSRKSIEGPIGKDLISPFLPKNPIIVEAGAHIGQDTIEMAQMWPEAKIYAFEPVPSLFEQLKENTKNFPNIKCVQKALSDKNGFTEMYVSEGNINGSSSIFKPKEHLEIDPTIKFPYKIIIETIRLEDWAKSENLDYIDFLWLDLQGAEYTVLNSCENILKNVKAIHLEANLAELYEGIVLYPEIKKLLIKNNFYLHQKDSRTKFAKFINVLFVKKI